VRPLVHEGSLSGENRAHVGVRPSAARAGKEVVLRPVGVRGGENWTASGKAARPLGRGVVKIGRNWNWETSELRETH